MFVQLIATIFIISLILLFCIAKIGEKSEYILLNNNKCDSFYLNYKKYYDTINVTVFNDNDLRDQLFPNFKRVFPKISENDCILDIGSNIGDITAMFHNYYEKNRIYLAEPLELNVKHTKNRFYSIPQIITIHTAIGFNRHPITFDHNSAGDQMFIKRKLKTVKVEFIGLDDFYYTYAKTGEVFFLKIDVEGYEDEVLYTGKKLLASGIVKYIYFEYHGVENYNCNTTCTALSTFLEKYKYNCYLVGKYKIIKINKDCYSNIDSQQLAHVIAIKDTYEMENKFVNTYNSIYNIIENK